MSQFTRRGLIAGAAAITSLSACATTVPQARTSRPGAWRTAVPESNGLSSPALDGAAAKLIANNERQGVVVIRHGLLVYEKYWANEYHLATPDWRNVTFSAGKSWGSTMVGAAYTQGLLGLDDLVSRYHPVEKSGMDPRTTIRDVLTMSSGGTRIRKPSSTHPKKLTDKSPPGPPHEYISYPEPEEGKPANYGHIPPGTEFIYDGVPADHLSNVVAAATGISGHRFMIQDVVGPLGCERFRYQTEGIDSEDNVRFGGSILISCRDMARLGQLYLNKGVWNGRRIISEDYVRQATTPSKLNPSYGFLWWLNGAGRVPAAPRSMFYAAGARGQFCFVLPQHDMVIASMGYGEKQLSADQAWEALAPALPKT